MACGHPPTFLDLAFSGEWIARPSTVSPRDYTALLSDPSWPTPTRSAPNDWCARHVAAVAAEAGIDPVVDHQRPRLLGTVLAHLGPRTGQELDLIDLARELVLGEEIVAGAVAVLADLDLIHLVPAWDPDRTGTAGPPVAYLGDPALARHLVGPEADDLWRYDSRWRDPLFETWVVGELIDQIRQADQPGCHLSHRRSARDPKLTLVVERRIDGPDLVDAVEAVAVEVKTMDRPRIVDAIELDHLRRHYGPHFRQGVIFHPRAHPVGLGDRLLALPLAALWITS